MGQGLPPADASTVDELYLEDDERPWGTARQGLGGTFAQRIGLSGFTIVLQPRTIESFAFASFMSVHA